MRIFQVYAGKGRRPQRTQKMKRRKGEKMVREKQQQGPHQEGI